MLRNDKPRPGEFFKARPEPASAAIHALLQDQRGAVAALCAPVAGEYDLGDYRAGVRAQRYRSDRQRPDQELRQDRRSDRRAHHRPRPGARRSGRGVPNTLVEIRQANAGGRYRHKKDTYLVPIDPNFGGCGRTLSTDENGFTSSAPSSPAPIRWRTTTSTAGGRRISMSRSSGRASCSG